MITNHQYLRAVLQQSDSWLSAVFGQCWAIDEHLSAQALSPTTGSLSASALSRTSGNPLCRDTIPICKSGSILILCEYFSV